MTQEKKVVVTNIQRMCMHDGPGIRTTVFLKGCSLHCPWCSNPENIHFEQEEYKKNGSIGIYGKPYDMEELYAEIIKDRKFFGSKGGVTFSGGEPLLALSALLPLLQRLKEDGIHICVETALHVNTENLKAVLPYIDLFFADMKILQPDLCREVLGGEVTLYLHNLDVLQYESVPFIVRIPCNLEYTLREDNFRLILEWMTNHPHISVEIFATHSLGKSKYESLGLECKEWKAFSTEELEEIAAKIRACGNEVRINSI
jgi:pyruvate formate lyase activating enzyme